MTKLYLVKRESGPFMADEDSFRPIIQTSIRLVRATSHGELFDLLEEELRNLLNAAGDKVFDEADIREYWKGSSIEEISLVGPSEIVMSILTELTDDEQIEEDITAWDRKQDIEDTIPM